MKIRIMGTSEELALARQYYTAFRAEPGVRDVTISNAYPNRGSNAISRLYVDITYRDSYLEQIAQKNK